MSAKCQGRHYTACISSRVASAVLGSRPDEPFPLWREQPQNGRDQEQGRNIAHEMAVLSTVVKRLRAHDRRVHDARPDGERIARILVRAAGHDVRNLRVLNGLSV